MQLIELTGRNNTGGFAAFAEGDDDPDPPEVLAIEVYDDESLLEEDVECELVGEDDLEEGLVQETLETLVHAPDSWVELPHRHANLILNVGEFQCTLCLQFRSPADLADRTLLICRRCSP